MLADDHLGREREDLGDPAPYQQAFAAIDADPNQFLAVAEDAGEPVGTLQLTFVAGLSRQGATRAILEAVRVRADRRGGGLGGALVNWAIDEARRRGCVLIQLTSDASRTAAHRFYHRLGFQQTHFGFKLPL